MVQTARHEVRCTCILNMCYVAVGKKNIGKKFVEMVHFLYKEWYYALERETVLQTMVTGEFRIQPCSRPG